VDFASHSNSSGIDCYNLVLWDALDMNNFYFLFLLFSDFIGILFSFSFSFLWDDKRHVTLQSHDMSHDGDVIGLEGGGRI